jgi:CRISPR-associated protein Cmr6
MNDLHTKSLSDFIGFNLDEPAALNNKINNLEYQKYYELPFKNIQKISGKIVYPGILIGSGYPHPALEKADEKDKSSGDYQLGFYFDHTTGMPVIPGSSVKGKIKSIFPKSDSDPYKENKLEYIGRMLGINSNELKEFKKNWEEIFFGRKQVFFDAYISGAPAKLFDEEFITPHPGIFKNPKPLRFIKIVPGTEFTFQFLLSDYYGKGIKVSTEQIIKVFRSIIEDFGIGAKTSVGYGYFSDLKII